MTNKMKTFFFGTPEFAASALEALLANPRLEIVAVVTQPDRPVGRKKIITPPPVKALALKARLKIFQPEKLKDEKIQDEILAEKPELCIVVAYGNLIPKRLLETVPRGFVNIHPSLLPKYRGATPLTATVLAGDEETGVCLMVLDAEMDHGPLIACRRFKLDGKETTESLENKLAPIGAEMLGRELLDWLDGKIFPQPQDHALATFCKQLESADAKIDWSKSVIEVERLVRAMHGVSPAWTMLGDQMLLIHRSSLREARSNPMPLPGTIMVLEKKFAVACADGYLILDDIQLAGGKPMPGSAFLNGHQDIVGEKMV